VPLGTLNLVNASTQLTNKTNLLGQKIENLFTIITAESVTSKKEQKHTNRIYYLIASSEKEAEEWIHAIKDVQHAYKHHKEGNL
jgi:hypothetical protein